jgi:4-amino-4-deoxy-L-arabinose transferase-like glycosyltransferase
MIRKLQAMMLAVIATVWLWLAGDRPLMDPDEARYAEIPREMLLNGDWVIPRLNGLPYLEKPPLQYWATMLAYQVFGVSEWSARFWTVLTSLATLLVVHAFARRTGSATVAPRATGFLASAFIFVLLGHQLTLDASLTFFMTLATLSFCHAQQERTGSGGSARAMLVCWAALAAAVLTKGVVAILLPGAVMMLYSLGQRDWQSWRHLNLRWGLPLFVLLAAPWFVLAAQRNADFLQFFFFHEHWQRFLTRSADRYQPWWFFPAIFLVGSMPWTVQAVRTMLFGWGASRPAGVFDTTRLLWVWCWTVLVFFSFSNSKLSPYILPMFPALALLIAGNSVRQVHRDALYAVTISGLALLSALLLALGVVRIDRDFDSATGAALVVVQQNLRWIVLALLTGMLAAGYFLWRHRPWRASIAIAIAWLISGVILFHVLQPMYPLISSRDLALAVPSALNPQTEVYSVRMYRHGLAFYWRRPLVLVDYRGELDLGLRQHPAAGVATLEEFAVRWRAANNAVAVMPREVCAQLQRQDLPMRLAAISGETCIVQRR